MAADKVTMISKPRTSMSAISRSEEASKLTVVWTHKSARGSRRRSSETVLQPPVIQFVQHQLVNSYILCSRCCGGRSSWTGTTHSATTQFGAQCLLARLENVLCSLAWGLGAYCYFLICTHL